MTQIASLLAVATVFLDLWTPFYSQGGGLIRETKLPMQELELKMQGGLMREGGRNRGILRYCSRYHPSLRPSSAREERGRVWNITPGGSIPKECCAQVIVTRNLAFVVSRAYKECKLRSILRKCARARALHAA